MTQARSTADARAPRIAATTRAPCSAAMRASTQAAPPPHTHAVPLRAHTMQRRHARAHSAPPPRAHHAAPPLKQRRRRAPTQRRCARTMPSRHARPHSTSPSGSAAARAARSYNRKNSTSLNWKWWELELHLSPVRSSVPRSTSPLLCFALYRRKYEINDEKQNSASFFSS
nr:uncharacterized protein LOC127315006 [Lolium perenne]